MVVVVMERVRPSVRGELTRWLIEVRTGVFVGTVSGLVRDRLWELLCERSGDGAAVMVYEAAREQSFSLRTTGDPSRVVRDFEGLTLVTIPSHAEALGT